MKEKFVNSSIAFISKYENCDDLKIKKLKYGLEGIYSLFVKTIVIILISYLTKNLKETMLLMLFYAGIRTFSYGMHAKSNLSCWITSIIIYNGLPLLINKLYIPDLINYFILGIALISVILWAPADTPKKPLIRKKQRTKCKILSIIVVLIYILIYFANTSNLITKTIIFALLIQSVLINPIAYKITNTRFNNYKYYKKS